MRSFNAAFYCKLYHRNASYKNSYKQSTLWTIETSSFHQNHPKSCTLFVQNLVVSPFILLQVELSGGEDVKMGVVLKSFQPLLLAVGVIRVRVASKAVEVPQLHLPHFGSFVFIMVYSSASGIVERRRCQNGGRPQVSPAFGGRSN